MTGLRGGHVLVSGALHLLVLAALGQHAAPLTPTRVGGGAPALRVQLLGAPAPATRVATAPSAVVAVAIQPQPRAPTRRVTTAATAEQSAPAPQVIASATTPPEPTADAPPQASATITGEVFALPTVTGFEGDGRIWRLRGAGHGPSPAARPMAADVAAALPWQQAQQAQQWQQRQAQAVYLQQAWAALQTQLAQWAAPTDPDAPPCTLPRTTDLPASACPGWSAQPGWPALLTAAQAVYQLAPVHHDLVLAYADARYRLELRP